MKRRARARAAATATTTTYRRDGSLALVGAALELVAQEQAHGRDVMIAVTDLTNVFIERDNGQEQKELGSAKRTAAYSTLQVFHLKSFEYTYFLKVEKKLLNV